MKQLFLECKGPMEYKVKAIKGVRSVTNLGLKEAKELVEEMMQGIIQTVDMLPTIDSQRYSDGMALLRAANILATEVEAQSPIRKEIANQVRGIVTYASISGQYDISHALLNLLETYFPEGTTVKEED